MLSSPRGSPSLSLLLPTRARPRRLRSFLESCANTLEAPHDVEVVAAIDHDDFETARTLETLAPRMPFQVVVAPGPPGRTMGALNQSSYLHARGRYLMAVNDDLLARTPGWDRRVVEVADSYPDGVVLVHVDDGLFGADLCTFPMVSRTHCGLTGGFCPPGYERYRIDDHIFETYLLLGQVGFPRIEFLAEVEFEHLNFSLEGGERVYRPWGGGAGPDAELFEELRWKREADALRLAERIDTCAADLRALQREDALRALPRPRSTHLGGLPPVEPRRRGPTRREPRVTVGMLSIDPDPERREEALQRLEALTPPHQLVLLRPAEPRPDQAARLRNRLLEGASGDLLVLLDDTVLVTDGWLEGLLGALAPGVGMVAPVHRDAEGRVSHSGLLPPSTVEGPPRLLDDLPAQARLVPSVSASAVLLDTRRCPGLRFDPQYHPPFSDLVLGLRLWEQGLAVLCSPAAEVFAPTRGAVRSTSRALDPGDGSAFHGDWEGSGRLRRLLEGPWKDHPELPALLRARPGAPPG